MAHVLLERLGWQAGTSIVMLQVSGLVVVTADPHGPLRVTSGGDLRLPSPLRHWNALCPGSRVLLVADPDRQRLVIHPPAWLDAVITREYVTVFGHGAA